MVMVDICGVDFEVVNARLEFQNFVTQLPQHIPFGVG
jgi:hypothetical protein